jgi:hypothetical protein
MEIVRLFAKVFQFSLGQQILEKLLVFKSAHRTSALSDRGIAEIQSGIRPDGRVLAPIMPWQDFAHLTKDDAMAVAAFLQSVKPVNNKVPGPFKPGEKVSTFTFRIIPPGETAAAAPK